MESTDRPFDLRSPRSTLVAALLLASLGACGGVHVGRTATEAANEPAPAASQPPDQDPDAPGETTPVVTVDLEDDPAGVQSARDAG